MPHKVNCLSLSEEQAELVREMVLDNHTVVPVDYLPSPCWLWSRGISGRFGYGHSMRSVNGCRRIHRLAFMAFVGEIPSDKPIVRHACHTYRHCCQPAHLLCGTQKDNIHDMIRLGHYFNRQDPTGKAIRILPSGQGHSWYKVSPDQVREIYQLWADGVRQLAIAKMYNIGKYQVNQIIKGKARKDIFQAFHALPILST